MLGEPIGDGRSLSLSGWGTITDFPIYGESNEIIDWGPVISGAIKPLEGILGENQSISQSPNPV